MSEDWQVGDLALCVDARLNPRLPDCAYPVEGRTYQVQLVTGTRGAPHALYGESPGALVLQGLPCRSISGGWSQLRFRKIRPDTHEPCEAKFVTLIKRSKRPIEA